MNVRGHIWYRYTNGSIYGIVNQSIDHNERGIPECRASWSCELGER